MRCFPTRVAVAALFLGLVVVKPAQPQNLDKFQQNLKAGLQGKATGFQYAIYLGETLKKSGGGGNANIASKVAMTADRKMVVASMSKTVTAVAVMKAIEFLESEGKNVTVNSKVAPFLPTGWVLGPHMNELTIRDLLRHLSGFRGTGDSGDFDSLRSAVAKGSTNANWQVPEYHNANFAMFRIVIPYMLNPRKSIEPSQDPKAIEAEIKDLQAELESDGPGDKAAIVAQIKGLLKQFAQIESIELRTAKLYVSFVQNTVLGAVGLSSVTIAPASGDPMTYYNFKDTSKTWGGYTFDDALLHCGANYWVFTAKEYGTFITGLQNGKIVSSATFTMMRNDQLGMYLGLTPPFTATNGGPNWNHNGGLTIGNGAGMQGDWMILPANVTVVVLVNSAGGVSGLLEEIIRPAWNASF